MSKLTINDEGLSGVRCELNQRVAFKAGDSFELLSQEPGRNDTVIVMLVDPGVLWVPNPAEPQKMEPTTIRAQLPAAAVTIV